MSNRRDLKNKIDRMLSRIAYDGDRYVVGGGCGSRDPSYPLDIEAFLHEVASRGDRLVSGGSNYPITQQGYAAKKRVARIDDILNTLAMSDKRYVSGGSSVETVENMLKKGGGQNKKKKKAHDAKMKAERIEKKKVKETITENPEYLADKILKNFKNEIDEIKQSKVRFQDKVSILRDILPERLRKVSGKSRSDFQNRSAYKNFEQPVLGYLIKYLKEPEQTKPLDKLSELLKDTEKLVEENVAKAEKLTAKDIASDSDVETVSSDETETETETETESELEQQDQEEFENLIDTAMSETSHYYEIAKSSMGKLSQKGNRKLNKIIDAFRPEEDFYDNEDYKKIDTEKLRKIKRDLIDLLNAENISYQPHINDQDEDSDKEQEEKAAEILDEEIDNVLVSGDLTDNQRQELLADQDIMTSAPSSVSIKAAAKTLGDVLGIDPEAIVRGVEEQVAINAAAAAPTPDDDPDSSSSEEETDEPSVPPDDIDQVAEEQQAIAESIQSPVPAAQILTDTQVPQIQLNRVANQRSATDARPSVRNLPDENQPAALQANVVLPENPPEVQLEEDDEPAIMSTSKFLIELAASAALAAVLGTAASYFTQGTTPAPQDYYTTTSDITGSLYDYLSDPVSTVSQTGTQVAAYTGDFFANMAPRQLATEITSNLYNYLADSPNVIDQIRTVAETIVNTDLQAQVAAYTGNMFANIPQTAQFEETVANVITTAPITDTLSNTLMDVAQGTVETTTTQTGEAAVQTFRSLLPNFLAANPGLENLLNQVPEVTEQVADVVAEAASGMSISPSPGGSPQETTSKAGGIMGPLILFLSLAALDGLKEKLRRGAVQEDSDDEEEIVPQIRGRNMEDLLSKIRNRIAEDSANGKIDLAHTRDKAADDAVEILTDPSKANIHDTAYMLLERAADGYTDAPSIEYYRRLLTETTREEVRQSNAPTLNQQLQDLAISKRPQPLVYESLSDYETDTDNDSDYESIDDEQQEPSNEAEEINDTLKQKAQDATNQSELLADIVYGEDNELAPDTNEVPVVPQTTQTKPSALPSPSQPKTSTSQPIDDSLQKGLTKLLNIFAGEPTQGYQPQPVIQGAKSKTTKAIEYLASKADKIKPEVTNNNAELAMKLNNDLRKKVGLKARKKSEEPGIREPQGPEYEPEEKPFKRRATPVVKIRVDKAKKEEKAVKGIIERKKARLEYVECDNGTCSVQAKRNKLELGLVKKEAVKEEKVARENFGKKASGSKTVKKKSKSKKGGSIKTKPIQDFIETEIEVVTKTKNRALSPWNAHVAKTSKKYPGKSFQELIKIAKSTYKK